MNRIPVAASRLTLAGIENLGRPYALGDATLDGKVEAIDLNLLGVFWQNNTVTSWGQGDFDGNGIVNVNDLNETPTDVVPNSFAVNENTDTTGGFSLGPLTALDQDTPDPWMLRSHVASVDLHARDSTLERS